MCVCFFSLRSLSWAGPSSPSEDIPRAGLQKTAGFGQETSQAQSAQYFWYLQRHSSPSSFKFCQKKEEKRTKKNQPTKKTNPNRQTEATTKESPVWKKKKTNTKKGKKLKLRHSCIAPKTTGNTSTGGVGLGVCTSATVRPGRGSRCSPGAGGSPVRILLDVVVRGRTVEETRVKGLALLPPGEHPGDGAEAHLLFLLFPFLVFQVL